MNIIEQIQADFKAAMLAHDEVRKLTISGLKSAMQYKKVELGNRADLTTDQVLDVVAAQVKQRDDAILLASFSMVEPILRLLFERFCAAFACALYVNVHMLW